MNGALRCAGMAQARCAGRWQCARRGIRHSGHIPHANAQARRAERRGAITYDLAAARRTHAPALPRLRRTHPLRRVLFCAPVVSQAKLRHRLSPQRSARKPHAHRSARAHAAFSVCCMPCHAMPHGAASVGSVFEASSPLGARQRPTSEHHHAAQVWYHAASAL